MYILNINFPGKNAGVGCSFLLQGIKPSNPGIKPAFPAMQADSLLSEPPGKPHIVKAMVFPVVAYGCECWTVKKAEHQRIDAFELWCWRRLLPESPLDSKEIKPVNLKGDQL